MRRLWSRNIWRNYITKLQSIDDYKHALSYKLLHMLFNNIKTYKAGVVLLYRDGNSSEMLFVKQRVSLFYGPPKGSADPGDKTAIDTAFREFYEETSVDLSEPDLCSKLLKTVVMVQSKKTKDCLIYFIVVVNKKPEVYVCKDELIGHQWVNISLGYRDLTRSVSQPTKQLLTFLNISNVFTCETFDYIKV